MSWLGPFVTETGAREHSEALMRELASRRGRPYPVPPDEIVGPPLQISGSADATHAVAVSEADNGQWWCRSTSEIEALPPGLQRQVRSGRTVTVVVVPAPAKPAIKDKDLPATGL